MAVSFELALVLTIIVPALAVLPIVVIGERPNRREAATFVASLLLLILVGHLYRATKAGNYIITSGPEILPGLTLQFEVEPLGLLFSIVASFLWLMTSIYSVGYMRGHGEKNQTRFYAYFAIAISAVMGIAFAANLFTLFIFYEILTLSTYPLVVHAETEEAKHGGRVYLGVLLSTSIAFFLLAIIGTWFVAGTLDFQPEGVFGPDSIKAATILLPLFVIGIGKAAIMPFHRWLPAAMVAPTPVSALLHAVAVVKAGVFTILKVCVYIFGLELLQRLPTTTFLLYLAVATVLLGSLVAMRQDNLKRRLAYSTVSQLGYIITGALLATASGVVGGAMHIAMHAFGKITLFFCAGAILVASHKTEISQMRGLGRRMPITMSAFFIGSLSIIGLPPTGGTWGKWFLMTGALDAGQWIIMAVLMLSSLLNIAYLLPIPLRAFFSKDNSGHQVMEEAPVLTLLPLVLTALACILLFFFSQPLYGLAMAIL